MNTNTTEPGEARLQDARTVRNVLVAPPELHEDETVRDFFGTVVTPEELASGAVDPAGKSVYLCGDLARIDVRGLRGAARVFVVRELSQGYGDGEGDGERERPWAVVGSGRVPLRVHGVGVYYRRFFEPDEDHVGRIRAEHVFQSLTESTKAGTALRTGIYLTPVTRDGDGLHFRLLRCSTNLSGPTENFGPTDTSLVGALNDEAGTVFRNHAPLNHVLAQIYHNTGATPERRQSKARISSHADKTKDMPVDGVMAFCTFYEGLDALQPLPGDPFDLGVKGTSALTRLQFRLKEPGEEAPGGKVPGGEVPAAGTEGRDTAAYPERFGLTLHPGSVFFMPLSTNRLYTHEIRPAALDAAVLPTRLGYVVRCSGTEAVHRDGRTFLKAPGGGLVPLEPPTREGMDELRRLYAEENRSSAFVDYGDRFRFSMNTGDYGAPRL
ncbi:hypothetical protein ACF09L_15230 [Streptomyces sp. NPDC014779]|uniref:hypothetical protein n=1 Tax=Streptomyces sp. NPDC014779 TaxID=3364911 RepID=UPI0036FE3213